MSIAAVVGLLQTALLLLTAAQSSPNLPPLLRESAIQIATHAIQQATLAMATGGAPSEPVPSLSPINGPGLISSTPSDPELSLSNIKVVPTTDRLTFQWDLSKPGDGKIFLSVNGSGAVPTVTTSSSGVSTHHILTVTGLKAATTYSYTIESISGSKVAKANGNVSTQSITPPPVIVPPPQISGGFEGAPNVLKVTSNKPMNRPDVEIIRYPWFKKSEASTCSHIVEHSYFASGGCVDLTMGATSTVPITILENSTSGSQYTYRLSINDFEITHLLPDASYEYYANSLQYPIYFSVRFFADDGTSSMLRFRKYPFDDYIPVRQ